MSQSIEDEARAAATGGAVRFEVVEHGGKHFAVRQTNSKIAKAINAHDKDDTQSRIVEMVLQVTHAAIPVRDQATGEQQTEDVLVPQFEPDLDAKGIPRLEPMLDSRGKPVVNPESNKPIMKASMKPKLDGEGKPVVLTVKRPKFEMGKRLFDNTFFDTFMEQSTADDSFMGKIAAAAARVNDREEAAANAKKP